MIVLGVDPGTQVTGYGVIGATSPGSMALIECGVIRTRPGEPLSARLRDIYDGVAELLQRHRPEVLSIEDVFYARNVRTTVTLGHARGVILLAAEQRCVRVHEMAPAAIKKAVVGAGAATKEQVQFMITRLLRLKTAPKPSDAADGVAAALAYVMGAHLEPLANMAARQ
ncbi:MAG TPA: crossover junction endodeoxyribonuclease RuvC [Gemmatimonadaceae bacterium]|nr:crossover junction endodeoxyribonuclease RuvC [Gemmatimonadaceae bacterium]